MIKNNPSIARINTLEDPIVDEEQEEEEEEDAGFNDSGPLVTPEQVANTTKLHLAHQAQEQQRVIKAAELIAKKNLPSTAAKAIPYIPSFGKGKAKAVTADGFKIASSIRVSFSSP